MESFEVIQPSPELTPYIQRYWVLKMENISGINQRIIPNGCVELMFNRGDKIMLPADNSLYPVSFIKGQNTKYYDLLPSGNVDLISVSFTSYGASTFFSPPINKFCYERVDVRDIDDPLIVDLSDRIAETKDNGTCIKLIEQFLIGRFKPQKDYTQKRLFAAIHIINQNKQIHVASLSEVACVSYRQFIRIFTENIGIAPKEYVRIIRFQRALSIMENKKSISSVDLAFEAGYYDQSHLINEFRSFTGYTPLEYLVVCQPRSDYFS
ncbi:MAG: helix-turn-helix domain-containing protein [Bacteroides sp.]|nr:helix-turn-helix domain-containing protein [Bacteroides sp.]